MPKRLKLSSGAFVHTDEGMVRVSEWYGHLKSYEDPKLHAAIFSRLLRDSNQKPVEPVGQIFLMSEKERDISIYLRGHHELTSFASQHYITLGHKIGTPIKLTVRMHKKAIEVFNVESHRKVGKKWNDLVNLLASDFSRLGFNIIHCYANDFNIYSHKTPPELSRAI